MKYVESSSIIRMIFQWDKTLSRDERKMFVKWGEGLCRVFVGYPVREGNGRTCGE